MGAGCKALSHSGMVEMVSRQPHKLEFRVQFPVPPREFNGNGSNYPVNIDRA
jgi:hypothetical protein